MAGRVAHELLSRAFATTTSSGGRTLAVAHRRQVDAAMQAICATGIVHDSLVIRDFVAKQAGAGEVRWVLLGRELATLGGTIEHLERVTSRATKPSRNPDREVN